MFKELSTAVAGAADAPLSIVILGVGSADFSPLIKLASKRKEGARTCLQVQEYLARELLLSLHILFVQFIALDDILESGDSGSENRSRIAQKALQAIPEQMTDFMHSSNIAAKPPIQVSSSVLLSLLSSTPSKTTFKRLSRFRSAAPLFSTAPR